jgi:hypothetical protein
MTTATIPFNVPVFIVMTRNGITGKIYINGKLSITGSFGDTYGNDNVAASIYTATGNNAATNQNYYGFTGIVDDVSVWDVVLTDQQIEDHYLAGVIETAIDMDHLKFHLTCNTITTGTVTDEVMNAVGDVTNVTVNESGHRDGALEFVGDGVIDFGSSHSFLQTLGNTDFTILFWMRDNATRTGLMRYWQNPDSGLVTSKAGFQITSNTTSPYETFSATILMPNPESEDAHIRFSETDYGVNDELWHHICVRWKRESAALELFIDGTWKELGIITDGTALEMSTGEYTASNNTTMGANNSSGTYLKGLMDDVMIFDNALTDAQILAVYNMEDFSKYRLYGDVTQDDIPANRIVRIYNRETGELFKETHSTGGTFDTRWMNINNDEKYYVVVLDDDVLPNVDPIVRDRIIPVIVT